MYYCRIAEDLEIVRTLVRLGACEFARAEKYQKIIRYLVANGADLTLKDLNGLTVYDFAKRADAAEYVLEFLKG
jgi:hypothetical protein